MSTAPEPSEGAQAAEAVAERWRAQEEARKRKDQKVVDEARSAAASDGEQAAAAAPSDGSVAGVPEEGIEKLAHLTWTILDVFACKLSPKFELTEKEKDTLAEATVPVIEKYFPDDVDVGPEGALLFTAAVIYGAKILPKGKKAGGNTSGGGSPQPSSPAGVPPAGKAIVEGKVVG